MEQFQSPYVDIIFVCKICRKEQAPKANWQRHFNTHSDERPYVCEECGKSYKRTDQLTAHVKKHAKNESTSNDNLLQPIKSEADFY